MTLSMTNINVLDDIGDAFPDGHDFVRPCQASGNNRSFIFAIDGQKYVIKYYFQDKDETRDRLKSEASFLTYLQDINISNVPKIIHKNLKKQYIIFTFMGGDAPTIITDDMVRSAGRFILDINDRAHHAMIGRLPMASDALTSIQACADNVGDRIAILRKQKKANNHLPEFLKFIDILEKSFDGQLKKLAHADIDNSEEVQIDSKKYIASPSDFGFHNVLQEKNGRCHFIDFEYAGRDDIVKLYCDFLLHPGHHLSASNISIFKQSIAPLLNAKYTDRRLRYAFPLLALKWACICCNIFVPAWLERRKFSNPALQLGDIQDIQLKKAYAFCNRIDDNILEIGD
jgi:hypothetical protein